MNASKRAPMYSRACESAVSVGQQPNMPVNADAQGRPAALRPCLGRRLLSRYAAWKGQSD
jgi:hypothetical protein